MIVYTTQLILILPPPSNNKFFYNENVWKLDPVTGQALHYDCKQVSGICVNRETALKHYRKRVQILENQEKKLNEKEFARLIRKMGFEPGTHGRKERVDDLKSKSWKSEFPIIDIRHGNNLSPTRWKKSQFRNQKFTKGWVEANEIPGWGKTKDLIKKLKWSSYNYFYAIIALIIQHNSVNIIYLAKSISTSNHWLKLHQYRSHTFTALVESCSATS